MKQTKIKDVNGFELYDYFHAGKWPAIKFQYRITQSSANVIGWFSYGNNSKTKRSRYEAIKLATQAAQKEDYQHQVSIHQY